MASHVEDCGSVFLCVAIYLSTYLCVFLSIHPATNLPSCLPTYLPCGYLLISISAFVYLSIDLSNYTPVKSWVPAVDPTYPTYPTDRNTLEDVRITTHRNITAMIRPPLSWTPGDLRMTHLQMLANYWSCWVSMGFYIYIWIWKNFIAFAGEFHLQLKKTGSFGSCQGTSGLCRRVPWVPRNSHSSGRRVQGGPPPFMLLAQIQPVNIVVSLYFITM